MTIYLYIKQHSITGLKYFGCTGNNPFSYEGSGTYWKPHIRKHGKSKIKTLEVWGFDLEDDCSEFAIKFSEDNNIVNSKEWANKIPEFGKIISHSEYSKYLMSKNKTKEYNALGKIWITNGSLEHFIKPENINLYPEFRKGRKDKVRKVYHGKGRKLSEKEKERIGNLNRGKVPKTKGKIWITKDSQNLMIFPEELEKYIGWKKGRFVSDETRIKMSFSERKLCKNRKRITCPYCQKTSLVSNMKAFHFEHCIENPNRVIKYISCEICGEKEDYRKSMNFRKIHKKCKSIPINDS